jgi:flagellar motor switch protein FliG
MMKLSRQEGLPESENFNAIFEALSNQGIQMVLREIDVTCMVEALKGCSAAAGQAFLRNMSRRLAASMLEEGEYLGELPKNKILSAQREITYAYTLLRERGDVD